MNSLHYTNTSECKSYSRKIRQFAVLCFQRISHSGENFLISPRICDLWERFLYSNSMLQLNQIHIYVCGYPTYNFKVNRGFKHTVKTWNLKFSYYAINKVLKWRYQRLSRHNVSANCLENTYWTSVFCRQPHQHLTTVKIHVKYKSKDNKK